MTFYWPYLLHSRVFQLTRSRGAWLLIFFSILNILDFNSHAHVERDYGQRCRYLHFTISTHTLTWSVTKEDQIKERKYQNFNSHAHVERDYWNKEVIINLKTISTHTLTWSVTNRGGKELWLATISTHTLTWSVTVDPEQALEYLRNFNSHAHVERDTWCCVYLVLAQRDADLLFYLMGIGLILFTVHSHIAWHFHANLLGICGSLGVRWSKY